MDNVLSQNEIDALFRTIGEGGVKPELDAQIKVRKYDFKRPNKFSKDQINTLHNIYEHYARLLSTHLAASLHTVVETRLFSIEQTTYSEFMNSLPNPTILGVCDLNPLGNALINISSSLAFTLVDRLLGGSGESSGHSRDLTEIERLLVEKRARAMVELLPEAWENIIPLKANLLSIESNPQFLQIAGMTDMIGLITIEVNIGGNTGVIHMCLPYMLLEPVLSKLSTQVWFTSKEPVSTDKQHIISKLNKVLLPIQVILGTSTVTLRELLDLSVGDVLPLHNRVDQPIKVFVSSKPKFLGMPGTSSGKVAIKITEEFVEGDERSE